MNIIRIILLNLVAVTMLGMGTSQAATPKNTFVMAKDIADIITMDPAEVFELTTREMIANTYDRIIALKSSVHLRCDFRELSVAVLPVVAPGPVTVDLTKVDFKKLRLKQLARKNR